MQQNGATSSFQEEHATRVQKQIQNAGVQLVLDKHQTFVPEQRICCAPSFLEAHREIREISYLTQDLLQTLSIWLSSFLASGEAKLIWL